MPKESKRGCGCCGGGILGSVGAVIAAILSWNLHHSVLPGLLHAFFSGFFVIYHWFKYGSPLP